MSVTEQIELRAKTASDTPRLAAWSSSPSSIKNNTADANQLLGKADGRRDAGGQSDRQRHRAGDHAGPHHAATVTIAAREAEQTLATISGTTERTLGTVTGEAERTLNQVFGHYENLWLGRTEAISGQIETRTRAVTEQIEIRIEQFANTLQTNSVTAAQALNDASGAAERTLTRSPTRPSAPSPTSPAKPSVRSARSSAASRTCGSAASTRSTSTSTRGPSPWPRRSMAA